MRGEERRGGREERRHATRTALQLFILFICVLYVTHRMIAHSIALSVVCSLFTLLGVRGDDMYE